MKMNNYTLPAWVVKVLVTSVIGALVTGASAWGVHLSTKNTDHEKRITVTESKVNDVKDDIVEIKQSQRETLQKLDRLLERKSR